MTQQTNQREIKFRSLYEGVWYYQTLEEMLTITLAAFRNGKHKTQFTGRQDKNGKDIYEGDLLLSFDGKVYVVYFESGCFMIDNEPLCFDLQAEERQPMKCNPKDFATIIGNIHENPELLNQ